MGCCESRTTPQNEPTTAKRCTDVFWLVLYIAFWVVMIIVSAFAFVYGNPLRIINGYDSFGNTCGVKRNDKLSAFPLSGINTVDKPYLFFMDIKELKNSLKICVKQCPTRNLNVVRDIGNFYNESGSNLCRYDFDVNNITNTDYTTNTAKQKELTTYLGPCPTLPVYESIPILNRCFPKPVKEIAQQVFTEFYDLLNSWETVEQVLSDLYSSWKEMLISTFVAFGLSLVMVSILHLLATLVAWIFMLLVAVSSVAGSVLLWYTYYELKSGLRKVPENMLLSESLRNERAFLWYSIIATIITIILLLLVFVMRKRVSFLAALFKETASCLGSIPGLFLQPIITFFFLMLFFTFWVLVIVCLATANYPGVQQRTSFIIEGTSTTPLPPKSDRISIDVLNQKNLTGHSEKTYSWDPIDFVDDSWVKGMWWICLICLIWTSEFILACQQMTITGAVAHWYFRGPEASDSPVIYSVGKLIKYHLGSMAKGSFLITLFKIPRLILTYIYARLKYQKDQGSECAKCGLKCGICCFYCLEKFVRYLNHNAYTIIAIESVHFCKAAGIAFNTLMNNALQMATINSVGDFILFLGKCIVTALTGIFGLLILKRNEELHFFAAPTLVICVFSFFIAHCILSLYEMVVDTLFLCVCEDKNLNGAEGRWSKTALAELASDERAVRKQSAKETESQPAVELQALQTNGDGEGNKY